VQDEIEYGFQASVPLRDEIAKTCNSDFTIRSFFIQSCRVGSIVEQPNKPPLKTSARQRMSLNFMY
jgi:hypothetical protein